MTVTYKSPMGAIQTLQDFEKVRARILEQAGWVRWSAPTAGPSVTSAAPTEGQDAGGSAMAPADEPGGRKRRGKG